MSAWNKKLLFSMETAKNPIQNTKPQRKLHPDDLLNRMPVDPVTGRRRWVAKDPNSAIAIAYKAYWDKVHYECEGKPYSLKISRGTVLFTYKMDGQDRFYYAPPIPPRPEFVGELI